MTQQVTYSDHPSTLTVSAGGNGVFGGLLAQNLHMTVLEDGLWIGDHTDLYKMKIEWKNVNRIGQWMKNQSRGKK